ncbi:MAG: cation diffusion facilitator family transporter [Thermomonas hydrothermalis]|nr:cation diffusion facilitator family transporter [Thermomonas hydrothermalis]
MGDCRLHQHHHTASAGHAHEHGHAHGHTHGHSHVPTDIRHERPLWFAFGLTLLFLLVEVAGGLWSNSLALLSDAAHMLTDVTALGISLLSVRLARRPADARRTYGYARLEALGALVNVALLFVAAAIILLEAVERVVAPQPVAFGPMLWVALTGLAVNLLAMRLLAAGAGENLNVRGAYLEVLSDMLGSLGVIIGAVLIHLTGWLWLDPLIAVLIALWVLPRGWVLLRAAAQVLMQGVPAGLELEQVRAAMQAVAGVAAVHDLHIWALGSREPILTAHVLLQEGVDDGDGVRAQVAAVLRERFAITHATLQMEARHCGEAHLHD